jgi:glutamate--cysteine ligase
MHTNQKLLIDDLLKKGAKVHIINQEEELVEIDYRGKKDFLYDRFSSQISLIPLKITADKILTKKILKENHIHVPEGMIFSANSYHEAILFAEKLYPVVLKPNFGSHGDFVFANIENQKELKNALSEFYNHHHQDTPFIIEKFYPWKEYRLFITENQDFAVIHRDWAHVVGDGISTIETIIEKENNRRKTLKKTKNTSLCPIVIDSEVIQYLKKQSLNFNHVLEKNQKIYLRQESNLAKGGVSINMTNEMPIFFQQLAWKILKSFPQLKLAGIDMLSNNIYDENPLYTILEVNSNPGLTMHHYPGVGKEEPVASYVAKVMFPDWFDEY